MVGSAAYWMASVRNHTDGPLAKAARWAPKSSNRSLIRWQGRARMALVPRLVQSMLGHLRRAPTVLLRLASTTPETPQNGLARVRLLDRQL